MPRQQQTYSQKEKLNIQEALKNSKHISEQKRLMCLKLRIIDGYSSKEISKITAYKEPSVRIMISKYNKSGLIQFLYKKRPGNNRKLTIEEESEFLRPFLKTAEAGQVLVVSDIHKAYKARINDKVSLTTIYYMLARHGWRKIMPRSKHPNKASDEAIGAYKKNC